MRRQQSLVVLLILFMLFMASTSGVLADNHLLINPGHWINLTSPNGGESLQVGSAHNVTWQKSEATGIVQIYYSVNGGTNWIYVTSVQGTSYNWTVPDNVTSQGRVRVRWQASDYNWYSSNSDANFTIYKPINDLPLVIIPATPISPTNLDATSVSSSEIKLTWNDQSNNETGFKIERRATANAGSFSEINTVDANTTEFTDSALSFMTSYTYRIRAYNANGNSTYSNEAAAVTAPLLIAPLPGEEPEPGEEPAEEPEEGMEPEEEEPLNPEEEEPLEPEEQPESMDSENGIVIRLFIDQSEYYVNGQLLTMDTAPLISGGRTLLPIRYVAEALGATVGWDGATQKVSIQFNDTTIELWINQNMARVNGVMEQIDPNNPGVTPLIIPPGRTVLPLKFIAENLGSDVEWEPVTREVTVIYPAK